MIIYITKQKQRLRQKVVIESVCKRSNQNNCCSDFILL